jgi:FtsP/CotA-like multicopper oxidase with cupredoxin domain
MLSDSMRRIARAAMIVAALFAVVAAPALAQHTHGAMAPAGNGRDPAWRMPAMPPMSPIPGFERAVPNVTPFLPAGAATDSSIPWAKPRQLLPVSDGDTVTLTAGLVRRNLAGQTLVMYGYNQQYPGPLLRVRQHATIYVRLVNEISWPTTVHWHGVRVDNQFDGTTTATQVAVQQGSSFVYRVTFQDAGIYWYHPHQRADIQQDLGLAGNILVDRVDRTTGSMADREEVLLLDDLLLDDQGILPYGKEAPNHALMGRFGNVLLANGEPQLRLQARAGEVVRFYFTNAASARTFNLSFSNARMKLIGTDMGRYERETWVSSLVIAPAERYVVDVRFDAPGPVTLVNRVQAVDALRGDFAPEVDTIARVDVTRSGTRSVAARQFDRVRADSGVIAEMRRYRSFLAKSPDHQLTLALDAARMPDILQRMMSMDTVYAPPVEWTDPMPMMNWLVTGTQARWVLRDPVTGRENDAIDDWRFRTGDLVKIRLVNDARTLHAMQHPIHIHGQRFLVLERDGRPNDNLAWKDTVLVPAGSVVDILLDASNPGQWMLHCHIAEHLEAGMHLTFTVGS